MMIDGSLVMVGLVGNDEVMWCVFNYVVGCFELYDVV